MHANVCLNSFATSYACVCDSVNTDNSISCVTPPVDAEVVNVSMPFHVCWNTSHVISCVITRLEYTYRPPPEVTALSRDKTLEK